MNVVMLVYVFVLFFVLTPGVLVYLPPKASKMVTNLTHAAIFALIWTLTHKMVWRLSSGMEGMKVGAGMPQDKKHHKKHEKKHKK